MHIGVPKEIMVDEYRLGMIPAPVREPTHHGYQVTAKTGADPVVGAVLVPSADTSERERPATAASATRPADSGGGGAHDVVFFVHERVPEIAFDQDSPYKLPIAFKKISNMMGGSRLVRYATSCEVVAAWTARALASLGEEARAASAIDSFACSPTAARAAQAEASACRARRRAPRT